MSNLLIMIFYFILFPCQHDILFYPLKYGYCVHHNMILKLFGMVPNSLEHFKWLIKAFSHNWTSSANKCQKLWIYDFIFVGSQPSRGSQYAALNIYYFVPHVAIGNFITSMALLQHFYGL